MQLKANFEQDWVGAVRQIMESIWEMSLVGVDEKDIPTLFFHAGLRRIEPRPRKVCESSSFECPPEHVAGWVSLKAKVEAGVDLSPHLSLLTQKPTATDSLLFDWGVYHLHLGVATHAKNADFVERTGPVLFGHPTEDTFYAIGIYGHGSWSDSTVIETMRAEWPGLTDALVVPGVHAKDLAHQLTDEDRANLRKANLNTFTATADGAVLHSLGGGFASNGISIKAVMARDRHLSIVDDLQARLPQIAAQAEAGLLAEGYDGQAVVTARLVIGASWVVAFDGYKYQMPVRLPA